MYPNESTIMVTKIEELDHIRASHGSASQALVFEDGQPRDGETEGGFEFVGLEAPSE